MTNIDKPELETLDYKPEQPKCFGCMLDNPTKKHDKDCAASPENQCNLEPLEQPNKELMIIKTIQGLTAVIGNNLNKLDTTSPPGKVAADGYDVRYLIRNALEEIDLLEKTTLYELQKAFE